jgi:DNA-binding beta-propeller fold protein YncE
VSAFPVAIAITPDGRTAYVVTSDDGTVTPIDVAARTAGTPITGFYFANTIAITPDGRTAYVGDVLSLKVIDLTTNTILNYVKGLFADPNAGVAITPAGGTGFVSSDIEDGYPEVLPFSTTRNRSTAPLGHIGPGPVAITPAQAPTARFTVTTADAGRATRFDASRSAPGTGRIIRYAWAFGDASTTVTTTPRTDHIYRTAGPYTAVLQVTNNSHTSTRQIFTGQTMSRDGAPRARSSREITLS